MKKSKIIMIIILVLIILTGLTFGLYGYSMTSIQKESEKVEFVIKNGLSKMEIINNLKTAGLIKSKYATLAYLYFNSDIKLQAGTYELDRNMKPQDIIEKISKGDVVINTISFTLVEGKNMTDFINLVKEKLKIPESEIKSTLKDPQFLNELIEKYDFLTSEILNDKIYYALEGYLFPDTYEIAENATLKDLIIKMLNNTKSKLDKIDFSHSNHSIHEILTMASIIELEISNATDRPVVSQVFWKKLETGDWLGSCVTTKYAVGKSMSDNLTFEDLRSENYYNTYAHNPLMKGKLPAGPIGSISLNSIEAALNPSDTDYLYFIANLCTGETFFNKDYSEHLKKQVELKRICDKN